jgi:anti-anti-sigma factor
MAVPTGTFEIEHDGQTLIITPRMELSELDFQKIEAGAREVLKLLEDGTVRDVLLDFHKTDYYGSTALGFFVKLWKRIRDRNGRMVFCRVSDHEKEILKITNFDHLWPIFRTRDEALKALREG